MKVLNLLCANDHRFEGWFASEDDYLSQGERGLLACPLCAGKDITRLPTAPRINTSRARDVSAQSSEPDGNPVIAMQAQRQAQMLRAMRHMMANTEDVGERFPEEARRIHHGEVEERGIRGRATRAEAEALVEEGIEVVTVSIPPGSEGPAH
ncbi:DUF1178 family protein [soil metagenome]